MADPEDDNRIAWVAPDPRAILPLGSAIFGESMFRIAPDASKVALVHLVEHLRWRAYTLLDIQVLTPHLERFGAIEMSRAAYEAMLKPAIRSKATWDEL